MGYSSRAFKGLSWAWGLSVALRGVSFIRILVLARVLSPGQFGIYGIALLVLALLETLTETGVNVFLIQEKEKLETYIDSAWLVSIFRGIVIFFIMISSSFFISNFFHTPDALNLLIVFSFVPLIRGFINPAEVKFQKEVNFDKEFLYRLSLSLVDTFVSVIIVIITKNILGLAVGALFGVFIQVVLSLGFIKPRPRLNFNKSYVFKIFHRGKWVTISGVFSYLFHNADNIVVGRLLGTSSLGLYEMAYNISMLPITDITNVVSKVTFPVYTLIAEDRGRLRRAFLKTTLSLCLVTIPFGVTFYLFPTQLISIFLGNKWIVMAPVLRILAVFGVIQSIFGFPATVFLSVGKQNYVSFMTLASLLTLLITIIPFIHFFGLIGAGYAALMGSLVSIPITAYFTYKVLK